jgi:hypothetical protein
MKKHLLLAGIASLSTSVLAAQANTCPATVGGPFTADAAVANASHDACTQAVDVFHLIAPQLGLALTGGNATLGQGGALGGIGHFAIAVRANAFFGDLPEVNKFPAPRVTQTQPGLVLPSKSQATGLPVVDLAVGLFSGFPLGLTNVGGVDLLVNAAYVPKIGSSGDVGSGGNDIQIDPQSNFKFGFGARVGLIQESLVVPGIGVTYIRRDLPTTTIRGASSFVDLTIDQAKVKTSAWRVVANKNFIGFGIAAGYGRDTYDESATVSGTVRGISFPPVGTLGATFDPVAMSQSVTRNNMFADLSINMTVVKLVGEIGQVSGGSFATPTNTFSSGAQDDSRIYASLGLRVGW